MKTSIKAIALATVVANLVSPTITQAGNFQYDGIELSYTMAEFEGGGPFSKFDVDGIDIKFNYSVTPNIVIGGGYFSASGKPDVALQGGGTRPGKYSGTGPGVFAFYHAEYNEKIAYQVGAGYTKIKTKFSAPNVDGLDQFNGNDDSKSLLGGIRYEFDEKILFELKVDYDLDADDGEDELSYDVGARYLVRPDIDVSVGVEFSDGGRSLRASIKKYLDFSR